MIKEQKDIDLCKYRDRLGEQLFRELLIKQSDGNFIAVTNDKEDVIIGYEEDNEIWIAFAERKPDGDLHESLDVFEMIKAIAIERGLKAISCMTTRANVRAFSRFGLKEHSVILKAEL